LISWHQPMDSPVSRLVAATNAGPLIYLSVLGRLPLLRELFAEVLLPDAVYEEVVLQGHGLPGANESKAAVEAGWLRRVAVQDRALLLEHNFRISGELYEQLIAGG